MNQDRIEGNWEQIKGKVRETWGKLTDDDMTKIMGQRQALSGRLQERYGMAKDAAEAAVAKFNSEREAKVDAACCAPTTGKMTGKDKGCAS